MNSKFLLACLLLAAGCSSTAPTIQTGPDAEVSYDGLHLVDNSQLKQVWVDPDINFSRYNKIMPGGSEFQFRAVKKTPTSTSQRRNLDGEFWISEADRMRLVDEVNSVFDEELAKLTRFEFTDARGVDVLMIRGGLHDIVSNVPPDLTGRGEIYLTSVGEATLIIEGVDSMSGEVIFRAIERRAAQRPGGEALMSNTVTTWAEVRRLARRWATTLREGLDAVPPE